MAKAKAGADKRPPGRPSKGAVGIQLRVPQEMADAIDLEAARLQRERPGNVVSRADVVREIIARALMVKGDARR